jgi:DUF971 family protein
MQHPLPKSADLVTPFKLRIVWKDGAVTEHGARDLRLRCPCAGCVDETSGRRILDPASVKDDILLLVVEPVGRYALTFTWSDGHRTGIFSWSYLRGMADGAGA